jgi:hypothetical protein
VAVAQAAGKSLCAGQVWMGLFRSKKAPQPRYSLLPIRLIPQVLLVGVAPAAAQDGIASQISFGVLAHDVPIWASEGARHRPER